MAVISVSVPVSISWLLFYARIYEPLVAVSPLQVGGLRVELCLLLQTGAP